MKKFNRLTTLLGMTLAGCSLSQAASAQDTFDGLYGGVRAGVGILKSEGSLLDGPFSQSDSSTLIGGILGARTSLGETFVIGVEADSNYYTSGSNWRYGISGIAGLKMGDQGLGYLRVGYGKLNTDGEDLDGLVLGGGYEHVLSDKLNLRFDYKNLHYTNFDFTDNVVDNTGHEITASVIFKF